MVQLPSPSPEGSRPFSANHLLSSNFQPMTPPAPVWQESQPSDNPGNAPFQRLPTPPTPVRSLGQSACCAAAFDHEECAAPSGTPVRYRRHVVPGPAMPCGSSFDPVLDERAP